MNKSDIKFRWSIEDGAFIVEVPEIENGMAYGQVHREVVQNTDVAVNEFIERAHLKGRIIPCH